MKLEALIAQHLRGTTLDYRSVKEFLRTPSHYHQWGKGHQVSQQALHQLNATDLFEFYLLFYLTGRHKTMQAVLRQVRAFAQEDAHSAHHLIGYSLSATRQHLLTLEWYELLPRLEAVRERALVLVPEVADQVRPGIISGLEASY